MPNEENQREQNLVKRALRRLDPVFLFGSLYLAAIPVFAMLYTTMPRGFFHATARYERASEEVRGKAASLILTWFKERTWAEESPLTWSRWDLVDGQWRRHQPPREEPVAEPTVQHWKILEIEDLRTDPDLRRPSFRCSLVVEKDAPATRSAGAGTVSVTVESPEHVNDVSMPFEELEPRDRAPLRVEILMVSRNSRWARSPDTSIENLTSIREILHCGAQLATNPNLCVIDMPREVAAAVGRYDDVEMGFPTARGSFWRMFYLSAVTATTVGFGDIVPLTDNARLAVSFEAIIEVILAGLFLSALAKKAAGG